MDKRTAMKAVRCFVQIACDRFAVKQIVLFGSYVRGQPRDDSDIDIAVILKNEPDSVLDTETELYRIGREIDARIEPILVEEKQDPSGFWSEISKKGKVVYSAI